MESRIDLLERLREGELVKLPSPKNLFASDVRIKKDITVFATSKNKIEYVGKHNTRDERETEMMDEGGKYLNFFTEFRRKSRNLLPLALDAPRS